MRFGRRLLNQEITALIGKYSSPTKENLTCLKDRQYQLTIPLVVTTGRCRYGHPQVVVNSPVNIEKNMAFSGMIRLTCPHLIKEIDILERDGGVARFNREIAPKTEAREDFLEAHRVWNEMRKVTSSSEDIEFVRNRFGDQAESFYSTGFLGIQMDRLVLAIFCELTFSLFRTDDVKCLHAHTADELLRGRNSIGKEVLKELTERGVNCSGCLGRSDKSSQVFHNS